MSEKKSGRDRLYEAVVLEENRGSVPLSYMTDGQLMGLAADRIEWLETQNVKPLATNEPPEPPLPCEEVEQRLRERCHFLQQYDKGHEQSRADGLLMSDALALIRSLKSENAQLRGEVEGLQELVDEVAPFFARAIDLKPGSHPDYIGARYKETAANWMLKPKFSAYLAKLTGEEPSSGGAG